MGIGKNKIEQNTKLYGGMGREQKHNDKSQESEAHNV